MFLLAKLNKYPIVRSSIILVLITVLVKVLGYAEKLILAFYWGTGSEVDTYSLVTTIVLGIFFLFREIVEPGYLTVFLKLKTEKGEQSALRFFYSIFLIVLLITFLVAILFSLFPDHVIQLFAPGFSIENKNMASKLIRIAGPACIFLALSTLTYITLNAFKQFAFAAIGDLMQKAAILVIIMLLFNRLGIYAAAVGIIAGALARLCTHLIALYRKMSFKFKPDFEKQPLTNVWLLTWPLLIGVLFSQVSVLVDNIFASYMQEGSISALSYSRKLVELPILLLPYALSVVVFPYLSQYAIDREYKKMKQLLHHSLKWIVVLFLPISICCILFASPLIEIVYQRGAFDTASTLLTAKPFFVYSTGLLIFALETIIVVYFFAWRDTKTPIFTGIGCSIFNIILTYSLIPFFGYLSIAISLVVSKTLKLGILLFILHRRNLFRISNIIHPLSRIFTALVVFTGLLYLLKIFGFDHQVFDNKLYKLFILVSCCIVSGVPYALILFYTRKRFLIKPL